MQQSYDIHVSRVDRISEVDFRTANNKSLHPASSSGKDREETSFLWTLGPRPFWELWPYKKHKKKKLSLEEFIQCLLEQWAVSHQYPIELASKLSLHRDQALKSVSKERCSIIINLQKFIFHRCHKLFSLWAWCLCGSCSEYFEMNDYWTCYLRHWLINLVWRALVMILGMILSSKDSKDQLSG